MRLLLVSAYFRPHVGGVERFVETLAEGLAGRGHDVTVLCCRTERDAPLAELGAYRVRRVPAANVVERRLGVPYPLPSPTALVRALRAELARTDVTHVQDVLYLSSAIALALAEQPVLTLHVGFVPQRSALLDRVERVAIRIAGPAARRAAVAVSMNGAVAQWAERTWRLPVGVAPVGVAPAAGTPDRAAFGLPDGRLVALFVGRDVAKKGLDAFAEAHADGWELVAVTDRPRPGLRTLPFMSPERLASLLASVDTLVLPSRAEGMPVILQEAMAAGLPVATTMQPGYEGYFGPDDIVQLEGDAASVSRALDRLRDPELRRRLAERGRAVAAERFSLEAMLDAYEALYTQAASSRRQKRIRSR